MKKIKLICYGMMIAFLITGCASTGKTKTSYAETERESPKIGRFFGGVIDVVGGVASAVSGNPIDLIMVPIATLNAVTDFKSVNKQTIKIEEHKDGSVTTEPIN